MRVGHVGQPAELERRLNAPRRDSSGYLGSRNHLGISWGEQNWYLTDG